MDAVISPEYIINIFSFLHSEDLLRFEMVSKEFNKNEYLKVIWFEHCKSKWKIRPSEIYNFKIDFKVNYKCLYFHANPIPNDLTSYDNKLRLVDTQVTFSGKTGKENRSVKSLTPFPPILSASDFSVYSYLFENIFCSKKNKVYNKMKDFFSSPFGKNLFFPIMK